MNIDRDLQSIQEVRDLVAKAKEAEKTLCTFPQEKVDAICASIASACMEHAEELAKMAVQETGFGKWEDKVLKNKLGSAITWESVKNMKTVGVLRENEETKVTEIGGNITEVDEWGKKKLAYEVQKMKEAFYYFIRFEAESTVPAEIESRVRIMDNVIRYLCVKTEA